MALTKHETGSVREMCAISIPLMISALSVMLMFFFDRLLIAHYSTEALSALVNATTLGWTFCYTAIVLVSISEVFVAQNNGAGKNDKLGEPVWQMLWLSLISYLIFLPMAYWSGDWVYGDARPMEKVYFSLMLVFAPTYAMYAALCGFFVGRGKTMLITFLAVAANLINIVLDYFLIFGIEGWIPSMGIKGAAIATCGSSVFQTIVLFIIFLNKKHRETCGTGDYRFKWELFVNCCRFGTPAAVFAAVEVLAWASYYQLMTQMSHRHILVAGICQSFAILFYFVAEGINKAASTICGNLIGAGQHDQIYKVVRSGYKVLILYFVTLLVLFAWGRHLIFPMFMPGASAEEILAIHDTMMFAMLGIVFIIFFEAIRMLFAGILTAAGDTNFMMWFGSLSVWVLMVAPVYILVVRTGGSVEQAVSLVAFYNFLACLLFGLRFYSASWRNISLRA